MAQKIVDRKSSSPSPGKHGITHGKWALMSDPDDPDDRWMCRLQTLIWVELEYLEHQDSQRPVKLN